MQAGTRNQLDEQLKDLVLVAQQHPHGTLERRIALTQVVNAIWQSGRLCHPYKGNFKGFMKIFMMKRYNLSSFIFVKMTTLENMTRSGHQ
jgi:hypothetical protein